MSVSIRLTALLALAALGFVGGYNIAATLSIHENTRGIDLPTTKESARSVATGGIVWDASR